MTRSHAAQIRWRLVFLITGNLALLVVMPMAAIGSHGRHYDGDLIVGALALSILALSARPFAQGRGLHRLIVAILSVLPALLSWEILRRGVPCE